MHGRVTDDPGSPINLGFTGLELGLHQGYNPRAWSQEWYKDRESEA